MPFVVVLDTCVLYPAHLRDTLLRLAERDLYERSGLRTSSTSCGEISSQLGSGQTPSIDSSCRCAKRFPMPKFPATARSSTGSRVDPKDRHVLAAAVRSDASAIVTFNEGDFPAVSVQPFEIEVIHPDAFLLDQLDLARDTVIDELRQQAAANRQIPKTVPDILDALARAGASSFADEVRRAIA